MHRPRAASLVEEEGQTVTVTVTPEPQAFALLGVGLTGLALLGRRKAA